MVTVAYLVTSFPGFSLILFSGIFLQKNICSLFHQKFQIFVAFNNSVKSFSIKQAAAVFRYSSFGSWCSWESSEFLDW